MEKIIIYQVFTRLFGNDTSVCHNNGDIVTNGCGKMADFTAKALEEIKKLGVTHIWYTGIIEHATQTDYSQYGIRKDHPAIVKGKAGSAYAIKDYYDVDPDLAVKVEDRIKEFKSLITRTHKAGLKLIMDFVPNHVARQYHSDAKPAGVVDLGEEDNTDMAFSPANNFYYMPGQPLVGNLDLLSGADTPYVENPCKATGNDRFTAWPDRNDWYETVKLNYGKDYSNGRLCFSPIPNTWKKMLDIVLYWAGMGVDGFRCDMAEMVPVEFWGWMIPQVKEQYPDIRFIAEVYNPNEYRNYIYTGKFDYLYDKVGLYDTLKAVTCGHASASSITGCWQGVQDIQEHMLNFLENHDEQRLASDFVAGNGTKCKAALVVSACLDINPMMIYFGQELGERGMDSEGFSGRDGRTTIFDYWSVDTIRRWRNKGKFGGNLLDKSEVELQDFYAKVLNLCNTEKALREGPKFDLMYVNYGGWLLNDYKHYAFLRKKDNEMILIVANFDGNDAQVGVRIPEHAYNYLKLNQYQSIEGVDLLNGTTYQHQLIADRNVSVAVPANSAAMVKYVLD